MMAKRLFDIVFSALGLIVLSPLLVLVALWIKMDSQGPVFFRQVRVGQFGQIFRIHKFRTMQAEQPVAAPQITVGRDARITPSGAFLRKYKIDELPQLIDVLIGKMSIVGPRPEVPKYIDMYPAELRRLVLSVKPGITDRASLEFREENDLLASAFDPEKEYIEKILPIKQEYYVRYVKSRNFIDDMKIIFLTLYFVFVRPKS